MGATARPLPCVEGERGAEVVPNKAEPSPGLIVDGKFCLLEKLGSGGMGSVWSAENLRVKKRVAVKFLHPEYALDPTVLARFHDEATAAGRIGSPDICDILDLGECEFGPYIVMEKLEGRGLDVMLRESKRLAPEVIVPIVRQALRGLEAAHQAGIVHRDLKPENLFVQEGEAGQVRVKLMDFGISKFGSGRSHEGTRTGVVLGTPEYMSPEQAEGASRVDERADVWAIGVILYRALTGVHPFKGPTMSATLVNLTVREPEPICRLVHDVPEALEDVVACCLAKDPAERYASARKLREQLAPFDPLERRDGPTPSVQGGTPAGSSIEPGTARRSDPVARPAAATFDGDDRGRRSLPAASRRGLSLEPLRPGHEPSLSRAVTLKGPDPITAAPEAERLAELAGREHPATLEGPRGRTGRSSAARTTRWALGVAGVIVGVVGVIVGGTLLAGTDRNAKGPQAPALASQAVERDPAVAPPPAAVAPPPAAGPPAVGPSPTPTDPLPSSGEPKVDLGQVHASGGLYAPKVFGPRGTHELAITYCEQLRRRKHANAEGWRLPTEAEVRAFDTLLRPAIYWTAVEHGDRAEIVDLGREGIVSVTPRRDTKPRALCVTRQRDP